MTKGRSGVEIYENGKRAFELDLLRGLAVLLMIVHHVAFDLRFLFGVKGLEFESSFWVDDIIRPVFLMVFLGVSGISTSFSRNNVKRGLRLLLVAIAFTLATVVIHTYIVPGFGVIYFNVLHVIALTTLFYAFLVRKEKGGEPDEATNTKIIIVSALIIFYGLTLRSVAELQGLRSMWLIPFGFPPSDLSAMDYMPLLPWSGIYLLGSLIGRGLYKNRHSFFPAVRSKNLARLSPFLFMGRHALPVYLFHQPLVYGLLITIQMVFGIFPLP